MDSPDMPQIANCLGICHQAPVAWKVFVLGAHERLCGGTEVYNKCLQSFFPWP